MDSRIHVWNLYKIMLSEEFWTAMSILLAIIAVISLIGNITQTDTIQDLEKEILDLNVVIINHDIEYCMELREELNAKNSLLINHCRRTADPWACGLGANFSWRGE